MGGRRLVLISLVCIVALLLVSAGVAIAVDPHRHCMRTPVRWVEVGPRVFKHPHLHETAFHKFHFNVHVSDVPTTIVGIFPAEGETIPRECSDLPL
jgi:hypothetical protein